MSILKMSNACHNSDLINDFKYKIIYSLYIIVVNNF